MPDGEERDAVFPTAEHWMAQKALHFGDRTIFERTIPFSTVPPNENDPDLSSGDTQSDDDVYSRWCDTPHQEAAAPRRDRGSQDRRPVASGRTRHNAAPATRNPRPKEVKALGRKVAPFDEARWLAARERIVLEGTLHKFPQHPALRAELLATGERELVEASPRDRIWGVRFGMVTLEKGSIEREAWGLNLLGRALMEARRVLRQGEQGEGAGWT
ncbi:hypothetical protein C8Q77DRAFT_1118368 [Trametes polyzona]|nr:hypothetical protein C8Q77DRAFT_1118368 [Trametes polyzona]